MTDSKKQRAIKRGGNIDPYNSLIYSLDFYRVGGEASQAKWWQVHRQYRIQVEYKGYCYQEWRVWRCMAWLLIWWEVRWRFHNRQDVEGGDKGTTANLNKPQNQEVWRAAWESSERLDPRTKEDERSLARKAAPKCWEVLGWSHRRDGHHRLGHQGDYVLLNL